MSVRIKKTTVFKVLMLIYAFMIYPPYILSLLPEWNSFYTNVGKMALYVGILLIFVRFMNSRMPKILIAIFGFTGWLFLCDVFNDISGFPPALFEMVKILGVVCVIFMLYKAGIESVFFDSWSFYFDILVIANLISLFACPNGIVYDKSIGWQPYYVIGNANRYAFTFLIDFYLNAMRVLKEKSEIGLKLYLLCGIYIVSSVKSGLSTTALIISILLLLSILLNNGIFQYWVKKHIKYIVAFVIVLVLFMVGGLWRTQFIQETLKALTGETLSFLERGYIWSNAVKVIGQSPIIGHGSFFSSYALGYGGAYRSSHNTFLQLMIYGGIPAILIFLYCIFKTIKTSINGLRKDMSYVSTICIFLTVLCFAVEQYPFYIGIFILMGVVWLEAYGGDQNEGII